MGTNIQLCCLRDILTVSYLSWFKLNFIQFNLRLGTIIQLCCLHDILTAFHLHWITLILTSFWIWTQFHIFFPSLSWFLILILQIHILTINLNYPANPSHLLQIPPVQTVNIKMKIKHPSRVVKCISQDIQY